METRSESDGEVLQNTECDDNNIPTGLEACEQFDCVDGDWVVSEAADGASCGDPECQRTGECVSGACIFQPGHRFSSLSFEDAREQFPDVVTAVEEQCFERFECKDGQPTLVAKATECLPDPSNKCRLGLCGSGDKAGQCLYAGDVDCPKASTACSDIDNCSACRPGSACDPESGQCVKDPSFSWQGKACKVSCHLPSECSGLGLCKPTPVVDCPSGSPCQTGYCDPEVGQCNLNNVPNGTACDDDNSCTVNDQCSDGVCTATSCVDDGIACTVDLCDPDTGCTHVPDDSLCPATAPACMVDRCLPTIGCIAENLQPGTSCNDGNPCTSDGSCQSGVCLSGNLLEAPCADGVACTSDPPCDVESGCGENVPNDAACDDSNPCTLDVCSVGGCLNTPLPGSACDDGDPCTENDSCTSQGQCGGQEVSCNDDNACTSDVCVSGVGCQFEPHCPDAACYQGQECSGCSPDTQPGRVTADMYACVHGDHSLHFSEALLKCAPGWHMCDGAEFNAQIASGGQITQLSDNLWINATIVKETGKLKPAPCECFSGWSCQGDAQAATSVGATDLALSKHVWRSFACNQGQLNPNDKPCDPLNGVVCCRDESSSAACAP